MSSKNNPENRGTVTVLRTFNGKTVKPTRIKDPSNSIDIIGACYENGDIVRDAANRPIPYQQIYG